MWQYIVWPIVAYMVFGFLVFEWAYFRVRSLREVNEARDSRYPAFRRLDVGRWRRWKFYPGAITVLPIRIIMIVIIGLGCYVVVRIVTLGVKIGEKPLKGIRERAVRGVT
jgi:hypothetical protein